ncbi:MAG: hypothetical protein H0T52_10170 [Lautropia sp.]|nr:hypothetical protein [Lautropia sp.]
MLFDPVHVQTQRGERTADVVVELTGDLAPFLVDHGFKVRQQFPQLRLGPQAPGIEPDDFGFDVRTAWTS